jgi:hypothetical protein
MLVIADGRLWRDHNPIDEITVISNFKQIVLTGTIM